MNPEKFALVIGIAVFVGGSLGLILHRILPEKHVTGGGKDMIGAVAGLLTLLSALVLGLLIWTAYGVYAGQNTAIQTLAAKILQFDLALKVFGPEASAARAQLRQGLAKSIDQVWGVGESDKSFAANNFAAATSTIDSINQSRFQMSFALANPIFHSARGHRGGMGDASLLRLRAALGRERHVLCRSGRRRSRGYERRLSDP